MKNKTHYLRYDSHRAVGLDLIINGLFEAINMLYKQTFEEEVYDGIWFAEKSEPIIGLAFVAFQNYINGSVYDYCRGWDVSEKKHKKKLYKIQHNNLNEKRTEIELIVALANYAKHKDEEKLHKHTKEPLIDFGLIKDDKPCDFLLLKGLNLLDENSDIIQVKEKVKVWREYLWLKHDE